jgi:hypothetical protein
METFFLRFPGIPLLATYPNVSGSSHTDGNVSHVNDLVSFDPQASWCVFDTVVPISKLFAGGGEGTMEDICYERLRAEACVD